MQETRIERSSARWFDFIILLPGIRLRPDGTLNFERIVLPLVCTKIAGAVPTRTSLQVLESEVRASNNAEECPYPVDGRCPHAGTGRSALGSMQSKTTGTMFRVPLEDKFRLAVERFCGWEVDLRKSRVVWEGGMEEIEGNGESSPSWIRLHIEH